LAELVVKTTSTVQVPVFKLCQTLATALITSAGSSLQSLNWHHLMVLQDIT